MSYRKQKGHMWGCRVVWRSESNNPRWHEEWMWDAVPMPEDNKQFYFPLIFTETRKDIMPLVKYMRSKYDVKSATPIKVPIPQRPMLP